MLSLQKHFFEGSNEKEVVVEIKSFIFFSVAEPLPFPPGGGKSFLLGGSDDVLESVLGLGDLADLTVTNDETDYSYDVRTHTFLSCCSALHKIPDGLEPCSL